jgi:hypothetical protein
MKRKLLGFLVAGAVTAASMAGVPAYAAAEHAHGHGHGDAAHSLVLNNGQKWESDEPLRKGMAKIRDAVAAQLPAIGHGTQGAQYEALGREIDAQLAGIFENCDLEPAADEVLHAILAEMMQGNDALQGKDPKVDRAEGVKRVVHSLELYAEHFQHPGFSAPQLAH